MPGRERRRATQRLGLLGLVLTLALGAGGHAEEGKPLPLAERIHVFTPSESSLAEVGIGAYPLAGAVEKALAAPRPAGWQPSGIDRRFYLDVMENIVRDAARWVNAEGRVIDPYLKREAGQVTPRFASSGAVLLGFGRLPEIRETVYRAMDHSCRALASGEARQNSPDFWMRELVTAYLALEGVAEPERRKQWAALLSAVEPEKAYLQVRPDGKDLEKLANWPVYASGGEAMREGAGLTGGAGVLWGNAFFEKYVGAQFGHFTANGMYRDPHDPFTYDVTTRLQAACGLAFGYRGRLRAPLEELLRRGGLTMLLYVSPEGFCPYGGRSAAFNFREAMVAAVCELEARRYKTANPRLAGAFKRQAHLSALSVRRWLLDMKPFRHTKNGFDPATRHGNDSYATYSTYGLLASSFLGLAALFADDAIAEAPCPAETGGFALELAPAFHKVFANCRGTSVEIDTAADPHYDATGLGCFAARGVPLELGLGMPLAAPDAGGGQPGFSMAPGCTPPPQPLAIGPAWQEGGEWVPLASYAGTPGRCRVIRETPEAVQFAVTYPAGARSVTEEYLLQQGKLTIKSTVRDGDRPARPIRFLVPLLATDGATRSRIEGPAAGAVRVHVQGHEYTVRFGDDVRATVDPGEHANRMALYRTLVLEPTANEITVELSLR